MSMLNVFTKVLASSNNAIRAFRCEELALQLDAEAERHRKESTLEPTDVALSGWIDATVRPNAFVTVLLPFAPGYHSKGARRVRDHQFYLNLWTRKAEAALWGASAFRVENYEDRCLFLFVRETIRQDWQKNGTLTKLTHYHAPCRMPSRPMLVETQQERMLSNEDRCSLLQAALVQASTATPAPYAKAKSFDSMRGANIDVQPYRREHSTYIFKQLRPCFSEHWVERLDDELLRDHGMFVLPHLRRR